MRVSRHDSFIALPFLSPPKKSSPPKPAPPAKTPIPKPVEDRLERLIIRLKNNSAARPKKKTSLLAHLSTAFGNKLDAARQQEKLAELVRRGILVIEPKDKVRYL